MTLSKSDAKLLLERLIFDNERPQDWIQDIWGLSPTLGEDAAKLWEVFEALLDCCPEEKLENLLQTFYQEAFDADPSDTEEGSSSNGQGISNL